MKQSILYVLFFTISLNAFTQIKSEILNAYHLGNYNEVIRVCDSIIEKGVPNFDCYYYKGAAHQSLYQYNLAEAAYEKALGLATNKVPVLLALAAVIDNMGDEDRAIEAYNKVLTLDSLNVAAKSKLATIYKSDKDYFKATALYSQLVKQDTNNAYFYSQLGYCCFKIGMNLPAINYYHMAISLNPYDYTSKMHLVKNLIQLKYFEDAEYWIDSFLRVYPENIPLLKQSAYLKAIGGNYLEAVKQYAHLIALGDSSVVTYKYYGQSLYNNGEYDKAIVWLDKYLEQKPEDASNQFIIGLACQQDYQYEKSLDHLDQTLFLKYDAKLIARIHREKANTYIKYGDYVGFRDTTQVRKQAFYKLAVDHFLQSETIDPENVGVYNDLGQFYMRKANDAQMALYYFQKYYDVVDIQSLKDYELENLKEVIEKLKEEVHFIGD